MINECLVTSAHFKHINVHIRILEDKKGIQRLILSEEQQRTLSLLFFDMVVINLIMLKRSHHVCVFYTPDL